MEDHNTNEKTSIINPSSPPTQTSDHGHDPPPPATAHDGDTPAEERPAKAPEPRKRKGCPSALDKCEVLIKKKNSPLNSSYSFTFDTKFCGGSGSSGTPESTPKFGSFNLVVGTVISRKEKEGEEGNRDQVELEQTKSG
ncbi:hypothetical protein CDL12_02873 [Handroanthus impetiginosus]|uniref:Uncharacterized protein n=1 Tax=Handroanthus impetiginosus TaxID=429701 RepID=A0A2G9I3U6_9LAMI|nr:hypothetical protein CDL12_02873 [Handroanthus impetiginosus]